MTDDWMVCYDDDDDDDDDDGYGVEINLTESILTL